MAGVAELLEGRAVSTEESPHFSADPLPRRLSNLEPEVVVPVVVPVRGIFETETGRLV